MGYFHYTGNLYPYYGDMNDFRIYDECLSASRVSDIYDSLICHFDFNIPYKDQNLASRGSQYNFSGFNGTENQCPIFASIPIDVTRMVEGEKLTISFDATFSDFTVANGKSLTCYFQSCLVKNGSQYWTTRLFETHGNFSKDVLAGGTFHYEWVQTIKSSVIEDLKSSTQCHLELRFDYAQSGKINITNTYVNYGDTIENNNYFGIDYIPESTGLMRGGVIHSSSKGLRYYYDSIMGENCLDLRGTDYTSAFQIKNFPQLKKSFTWNVWIKQEESNSQIPTIYQSILSYGRDWSGNTNTKSEMGMNISLNRGAPDIRYGHYDDENSSPNTNMQLLSSKKVNDGNWHMISTVMGDDGIMTLYIDGVKDMTASKSTYCSYSHASGGFIVGKMSYEYYSTSTYFPFNGMIDDVKVYATALSEDKIKKLYNVKSRIDKNGNLYCNQFIDNDYEEELLTTQKMTFYQANSQGTITYETNGNEVINIITMDNTISSWKYLFNNAFDKTKIINHKLKLSFKYKTNVSTAYSMAVKMCKGDSTKPQTINIGSITLSTNWQEYNGIITFGNTYDNQGIYIHTGNFCGGNLYIKDLSLKIYENNNKTDFTKKSQIITGELSELDSNKTYVYKNSKIVTNQIIEN